MTSQLKPERLTELRSRLNLTQAELAKRARLNQQTICRLEAGDEHKTRQSTLVKLASAMNTEIAVLTGAKPLPPLNATHSSRAGISPDVYQLNVRIRGDARNAFTLASRRYNVPTVRMIELAPFLFAAAAELSLKRRRENLDKHVALLGASDDLRDKFHHLPVTMTPSYKADEPIRAEKKSIEARDITGDMIFDLVDDGTPWIKHDYDQTEDNPFVRYLQELVSSISESATIDMFVPNFGSRYEICRQDVLALTGGDEHLADCIAIGSIPLHEMPANLFDPSEAVNRIDWMKVALAKNIEAWEDLVNNRTDDQKGPSIKKEDSK